ncbi:YybS family protein [Clostridium sediminicola]|uniref:YybS family protein n=1 Tax=Clostridium sediminicola TaxID=3114879 RepID=UPI0031F1F3F9
MENKKHNTKSMVEAGLISALIFVIFLISAYTSMLSSVGAFILPIPVTILYIRYDFKTAILSVVVSFILVSLMWNVVSALIAAVTFGLIGLSFGYCINKNFSKKLTLFILTIVNLIAYIFQMVITLSLILKQSLVEQIQFMSNMFNESMDMTIGMYQSLGMTEEQLKTFDLLKESFSTDFILKMLPASILFVAIVSALLNYTITRRVFCKLKYNKIEKFGEFQYFYISNIFTAGLIIIWLSGILLTHYKLDIGEYLQLFAVFTMQILFMLNGLALLIYYIRNRRNKNISKILIVVIAFLGFTNNIFAKMFFFTGLAESIIDLRKLDPYSTRKRK